MSDDRPAPFRASDYVAMIIGIPAWIASPILTLFIFLVWIISKLFGIEPQDFDYRIAFIINAIGWIVFIPTNILLVYLEDKEGSKHAS